MADVEDGSPDPAAPSADEDREARRLAALRSSRDVFLDEVAQERERERQRRRRAIPLRIVRPDDPAVD